MGNGEHGGENPRIRLSAEELESQTIRQPNSWLENLVGSSAGHSEPGGRRARGRWALAVGLVLWLSASVGGYVALTDNGSSPTTLMLRVPALGIDCPQVKVESIQLMEKAFEATAVGVDTDKVTLRVDHWYTNGDAEIVELTNVTNAASLLEGGIDFQPGERYLIAASGGVVATCGFSARWTQLLAQTYKEAF